MGFSFSTTRSFRRHVVAFRSDCIFVFMLWTEPTELEDSHHLVLCRSDHCKHGDHLANHPAVRATPISTCGQNGIFSLHVGSLAGRWVRPVPKP